MLNNPVPMLNEWSMIKDQVSMVNADSGLNHCVDNSFNVEHCLLIIAPAAGAI
jgi:hypothetical protein